ncbi:Trophoblast glycoprotein, partial [Trichinella murrelli]
LKFCPSTATFVQPASSTHTDMVARRLLLLILMVQYFVVGDHFDCNKEPYFCLCSDSIVNCTNRDFTRTDIFAQLQATYRTLNTLIVTGNNFRVLNNYLFGSKVENPSLDHLDLSNNSIALIEPEAFHGISKLETLLLNDNRIVADGRHLQDRSFLGNLNNLRILQLNNLFVPSSTSDNRVRWLRSQLNNTAMEFIEYLHLESNNLQFLPADFFCIFPNLQFLYLARNSLTHFLPNYQCIKNLRELDLSANAIVRLGSPFTRLIDSLVRLEMLLLASNPWQCTCDLSHFIGWLKRNDKLIVKKNITCATAFPEKFVGHSLQEISEKQLDCSPDGNEHVYGVYIVCGLTVVGLFLLLMCILSANKFFVFKRVYNGSTYRMNDYQPLQKEPSVEPVMV